MRSRSRSLTTAAMVMVGWMWMVSVVEKNKKCSFSKRMIGRHAVCPSIADYRSKIPGTDTRFVSLVCITAAHPCSCVPRVLFAVTYVYIVSPEWPWPFLATPHNLKIDLLITSIGHFALLRWGKSYRTSLRSIIVPSSSARPLTPSC